MYYQMTSVIENTRSWKEDGWFRVRRDFLEHRWAGRPHEQTAAGKTRGVEYLAGGGDAERVRSPKLESEDMEGRGVGEKGFWNLWGGQTNHYGFVELLGEFGVCSE